jgi:hypothetical protein
MPGLTKLLKQQRKELAEAKAALKEFREADTRRRSEERVSAINAIFDTLNPALKRLLGSGPVHANPKSLEYKRRCLVFSGAGVNLANDSLDVIRQKITTGANQIFGITDEPIPAEDEPYPQGEVTPPARVTPPRAANGQFKPTAEDEEVEKRRRDWQDAPLGKPSGRQGAELPPGEKKAMQTWKRGADALFGSEDDLDTKAGY